MEASSELLSAVLPKNFIAKIEAGSLRTVVAEHIESATLMVDINNFVVKLAVCRYM